MAVHTADFEVGTNGNTIATGDTGSLTAWNTVTGSPKYSNTHVFKGTMAAKPDITGTNYMAWTGLSSVDDFGRAYFYFTGNPTARHAIITGVATGRNCLINLSTAGKIQVFNTVDFKETDGAVAISTNAWIRIEYHFFYNGSTGIMEAKLYNTPDSTTVTETITVTAANTGAVNSQALFGAFNNASGVDYWIDNAVAQCTSYPGPFPVNTVAPGVTGSAPVGSTLTCDGGTWNGGATFTLTYQWTRDGSNIGGATSSTYVTVAGDSGHAVGCKVTATGVQATNESALQASGNTITVTSGGGGSTKVPIDSFAYSTNVYARDSSYASTDAAVTAVPALFIDSGGAKTATTSFVYHDATTGKDRSIWAGDKVAITDNAYLAAPNNFA